MPSYDRAITVFSPDGHLQQVEYAFETTKKGLCAVGVKARDGVVIVAEKRGSAKLQDTMTARKIELLDDGTALAFAGLTADGRVLVSRVQVECQSYRLDTEEPPSVEYLAKHVASIQQKFSIRGGRRPFGVACLLAGYTHEGLPGLCLSEPSGIATSWKAAVIGRNAALITEYIEKHIDKYNSDSQLMNLETAKKFAIEALMETIDIATQGIDGVVVTKAGGPESPAIATRLLEDEVDGIMLQVQQEQLEASSASGRDDQSGSVIRH